jgi:hypothetical protein
MNLGKLLGAGKSFVSGRDAAAYRTDKRVYLPQFVSSKNPFASAATTVAQAELSKPATPVPASPVKKAALPWAKTQKISALPPVAAPAAPARTATWVSKFNPVSMFRDATAAPNKFAPPMQAELSLEKVKVVHNDLTDAEVEIVPMKSRPARGPVPADLPPAKKTWEMLGERIMKATAL